MGWSGLDAGSGELVSKMRRRPLVGWGLMLLCLGTRHGTALPAKPPVVGQLAPAFTLRDVRGRSRTLASFRGHPVALFFFCGCPRCHAVAEVWAQAQGDLGTGGPPPYTVIVFSDTAPAAKAFATGTGLTVGPPPSGVTLLTDATLRVTDRYGVSPCPRVFVLDAAGRIRDTNPDPDAPALAIVSRALSALRRAVHRRGAGLQP